MKTIYKKIILITIITIAILLLICITVLLESFKYGLFNPHIYKICSDKTGTRHAIIFNRGALQGYELCFGITDESKPEPNLIFVGPVDYTDYSFHLMRVVISADHTVVATESYLGDISYWLAYDFTNSISYGSAGSRDQNQNLINARNKAILDLIQSRGGITPLISDTIGFIFFNKDNKLSYLAWKRWEKKVEKAREECKPWVPVNTDTNRN